VQILSCTGPGKQEDEKTISKTGKNRQKPAMAAAVGKQKECLAERPSLFLVIAKVVFPDLWQSPSAQR
jgi:hypothetical protein